MKLEAVHIVLMLWAMVVPKAITDIAIYDWKLCERNGWSVDPAPYIGVVFIGFVTVVFSLFIADTLLNY